MLGRPLRAAPFGRYRPTLRRQSVSATPPAEPSGQDFDEGTDTGTQWFVRPNGGAYGSENGTSWTNAFDGFSDIAWGGISAGDTIWVAGGTYTQNLDPTANGTAGSPIKIRRARSDSSACTGGAGWSVGYDSDINHTAGFAWINSGSYVIVSGAKTQSGGNVPCDDGSCGWKVTLSGVGAGNAFAWYGSAGHNTIRWIEIEGPGKVNITTDNRGFDMTPSAGTTVGNVIGHVWGHDFSEFATVVASDSPIFEYCVVEDLGSLNTATYHPNGIITWGAPDGIMRYCIFRQGPNGFGCGEGMFFEQAGGSTGWQIYGNVFHDITNTGEKAIEITSAVGAIKIFNNTFVNVSQGTIYTSNSPSASGGEQRNNYVYNCAVQTGISGITSSSNITATNTAQFVNYAARDLHIVSGANARNAGTALTTNGLIDKDMDGNTRGADGTWDVGAYEYT
jgi:hypothetical protein